MLKEDKLRFELGSGFNRLSEEEVSDYTNQFDSIFSQKEDEYGYSGDGPYYDAIEEYMYRLREELNDEDFVQVAAESFNCAGWILHNLNDQNLIKYAKEYVKKRMKDGEYDYDEEEFDYKYLP